MTKHIHADLMLEYAKDALETDKPHLLWQYYSLATGTWTTFSGGHPSWVSGVKYRRKPKTISINGHFVPEPLRTAPEPSTAYYIPCIENPCNYYKATWFGSAFDLYFLGSGLVHSSKEDALVHAKAILSFTTTRG